MLNLVEENISFKKLTCDEILEDNFLFFQDCERNFTSWFELILSAI